MNFENFSFSLPTKIVYGLNSIKDLDNYINNRKTLLITSKGFVERGLIDAVNSYTNCIVETISSVKSHPEFKDLEKIYKQAYQKKFELIVAIGGGSVMDVAKFISVSNENQDYKFVESLTKGKIPKKDYKRIPIISVPTTAGTGSEVTPYSTIWDMKEKKKYSLTLPNLFCEIAIYDPILTLSVPKNISIQTGLDSLSHALESIWNKNANPITIIYSVKSAKLIMENLAHVSKSLNNIDYRSNMMKASMYAGIAISNTQTAIAHGMSYYVTTHKGVDHGIACSFTLPMLIDNVIGKYEFIDNALKKIFGELSSKKLRALLKELNVSTKFSSYGIDSKELEKLKDSLNKNPRAANSLVQI
tara:strand:- start:1549 stop:2625 length:1077 start_codon:yes stop_codon:yes gene_type:complete